MAVQVPEPPPVTAGAGPTGEPTATPPPVRPTSRAARRRPPPNGLKSVQVFYGTNRVRADACEPQQRVAWDGPSSACHPIGFYRSAPAMVSPGRSDELEVGTLTVTLPPGHVTGQVERPLSVLSFQLRGEDPMRDVVISDLRSVGTDYDAWLDEVKQAAREDGGAGKDAVIYVHGFNVSFENAARLAGQLAADLDFAGVPMMYSWPSNGGLLSYVADYDAALDATEAFNHFLDLVNLEKSGVRRVHVIAHSMGNWLVANALRERWLRQGTSALARKPIEQLVLAAPDVWADRFRERFLATLPKLAAQVTLYVSDGDRALQTSKTLRDDRPRVGLREGLRALHLDAVHPEGFDAVDATGLPSDFLDHSYYASNQSMISDIYCVLLGSPANRRQLIEQAGPWWQFKADRTGVAAGSCAPGSAPTGTAQGPLVTPATPPEPVAAGASSTAWWWLAAIAGAIVLVLAAGGVAIARRPRAKA